MDSTNAPRYPKKDSAGTPRTRGSMVDRATMDEPMNRPATIMPNDSLLMMIERLRMGASDHFVDFVYNLLAAGRIKFFYILIEEINVFFPCDDLNIGVQRVGFQIRQILIRCFGRRYEYVAVAGVLVFFRKLVVNRIGFHLELRVFQVCIAASSCG